MAKVGAHIPSFTIDFMAAHALGFGAVEEYFLPIGGVATEQRRSKPGHGIVLWLSGRVAGEFLFHNWRCAFRGGVEKIEPDLIRQLSGNKLVEPMSDKLVGSLAWHIAKYRESGLFVADGAIVQGCR